MEGKLKKEINGRSDAVYYESPLCMVIVNNWFNESGRGAPKFSTKADNETKVYDLLWHNTD